MILYGFADSVNECANTLCGDTGRVRNVKASISGGRRQVVAQVGGASGVFNFYNAGRFPEESKTVSVSYDYYGITFNDAETLARAQVDALAEGMSKRLYWVAHEDYIQHAQPPHGSDVGAISGVVRIAATPQRYARVAILTTDGQEMGAAVTAADGSYTVSNLPIGTYSAYCSYWEYGNYEVLYTGTVASIAVTKDTTTTGQNITITTVAGAVNRYRWAYASLIRATVIADPSRSDQQAVRVEADFLLPEGVFYSAQIRYSLTDEGDSDTITATYNGTIPGFVYASLKNNAANTLTYFKLTNSTASISATYSGTSIATGKTLIIDSAAGTITNDGTGDFAHLARETGQLPFFYLKPSTGNTNTLTKAITTQIESNNYDLTLRWYDTYGSL